MDESKYKYKVITIPNILSFIRVLMIPLFVWFSVKGRLWISLAIICASWVTDIVDGFIARRYNMVSNVGRILDPIADKLTQLAVMICICLNCRRMLILVIALVVKEVTNGVIGLVMMKKHRDALDSKWHGKLATTVIYITIVAHLIWWQDMSPAVSYLLIGATLAIMTLSFVLYTARHIRIIKGEVSE